MKQKIQNYQKVNIPEDADLEKLTDRFRAPVSGVIRLKIIGYFSNYETAREQHFKVAGDILGGQA